MNRHHIITIGGRATFAALLFIGFTALAIELKTDTDQTKTTEVLPRSIVEGPLDGELRWCRHLGDEALHDKACLKAWAQNRERFLKYAPPKSIQTHQD